MKRWKVSLPSPSLPFERGKKEEESERANEGGKNELTRLPSLPFPLIRDRPQLL